MFLILKSARIPPQQLAGAATAAVQEIDPNQPVFDVATMEERLGAVLAPQRANMTLMSAFAALALLLSAIGIFGVIAYFVSQRKHEIGIRMALGARRSAVLKIVLGRGLALTGAGLALGIAGSLLLTRALGAMLAGVKASDPAAYSVAAALFLLVAAAACWIPARSAARVDPATTLRDE